MKPLLSLFVLLFALVSCNNIPGNDKPIETDTLPIKPIAQSRTVDPAVQRQQAPAIVNLPFGPRAGAKNICNESMFYLDIIGEGYTPANGFKNFKPTYPLPPIEKYMYTVIDTVYDPRECAYDISMDSVFRVTSYKVRLPDHEGFEVYY